MKGDLGVFSGVDRLRRDRLAFQTDVEPYLSGPAFNRGMSNDVGRLQRLLDTDIEVKI